MLEMRTPVERSVLPSLQQGGWKKTRTFGLPLENNTDTTTAYSAPSFALSHLGHFLNVPCGLLIGEEQCAVSGCHVLP